MVVGQDSYRNDNRNILNDNIIVVKFQFIYLDCVL